MVKIPDVIPKYTGTITNPHFSGFLRRKTPCLVIKKIIAANAPAIAGAITQLATICTTPFFSQLHDMPSAPTVAIPIPITPPTMQCVVDTGRPIAVATVSQVEEPTSAHNMPSISTPGSFWKSLGETASY
jgi:hypothetical protein